MRKALTLVHKVIDRLEDLLVYWGPLQEPLLFNAMPKSASSFFDNALPLGLKARQMGQLGGGAWPHFYLNQRLVEKAVKKRCCASQHLGAEPINLTIINQYYTKMIVHVRDPRQATLSNLHNCLRNEKKDPIFQQSQY